MPFPNIAFGQQRVIDAHLRFMRCAGPVFLRLKNFATLPGTASQLGFSIAPTGTSGTGTKEIEIVPRPAMTTVSVHNIGMSGGKLRFGARIFRVSDSFVQACMKEDGITVARDVWQRQEVVGLVTEGLLFSIEDIKHSVVGDSTLLWTLTCNSNTLR